MSPQHANGGQLPHQQLEQLRQNFRTQLPERLRQIDSLMQLLSADADSSPPLQETLSQLQTLTHNLTGAAGTFGLSELSRVVRACNSYLNRIEPAAVVLTTVQQHQLTQLWQGVVASVGSDPRAGGESLNAGEFRALASQEPPLKNKQLIVVEDDTAQAEMLHRFLTLYGYEVRCATDIAGFEVLLKQGAADLVLMDIVLSSDPLGGTHIVKRLRDSGALNCPVVFTTIRDDFEARLEAVRGGGDGYLVKPIDTMVLIELARRLTTTTAEAPYRILVVDDEPMVAYFNVATLQQAGLVAHAVTDPRAVMALLDDYLPDLILLDINMPYCNGLELATLIRQLPDFSHLPIVFLSGESESEKGLLALRAGGDDFIHKGSSKEALIAAVSIRAERGRLLTTLLGAMRASESRYRSISHSAGEAILCVDREGNIVIWNMAAERTFGHSAQQQLGQSVSRIVSTGSARMLLTELARHYHPASAPGRIELIGERANGSQFPLELSMASWSEQRRRYITLIARDLSLA